MENGDGSRRGGRKRSVPEVVAGMVGAGAGIALALWLGPLLGVRGFWAGLITVMVAVVIGIVVAQMVGSLLFPRPPDPGHT